MINQYMIEYFEESKTSDSYINALDNIRSSLMVEVLTESSNNYYYEASKNFTEAIKEFFAKLIQAIKDLVKKIKDYIHEKLQNIQMNKKLNELKKTMVENRSKLNSTKVTILDTTKYMIAYRKYINLVTTEFRKLTSKKYENSGAFQKEAQRVNELIDSTAEKLGLTSSEKYAIETDVFNALSVAEKSIKLYDNEFNLSAKEWEDSIRTNGKTAEMEENPTIADRIKVLSHKFSNVCSKCFQFMSKHPIASISIITAAVAGVVIVASAKGAIEGEYKYNNSDIATQNIKNINDLTKKHQDINYLKHEIDKSNKELKDAIDINQSRTKSALAHRSDMSYAINTAVNRGIISSDNEEFGTDFSDNVWDNDRYNRLINSISWDAPLSSTHGNNKKANSLRNNPEWGLHGIWID